MSVQIYSSIFPITKILTSKNDQSPLVTSAIQSFRLSHHPLLSVLNIHALRELARQAAALEVV